MRCLMFLWLQDEWSWWPARGGEARARMNEDGWKPLLQWAAGIAVWPQFAIRMDGDDNRIDKDIELQKRGRMWPIATCLYESACAFVRGRPFGASVSTIQDGGVGVGSGAYDIRGHGEDRDLLDSESEYC
jgi:hypothetical protein